jgi:hypothetical protein
MPLALSRTYLQPPPTPKCELQEVKYKGKPLMHYMELQQQQLHRQQEDAEADWSADSSSSEDEAEETYEEQDDEEEESSDEEEQEEEEEEEEGEEVSVPPSRTPRAAGRSAVPMLRQRQQVAGEPGAGQASLPGAAAALTRQRNALVALRNVSKPLEKIQVHAEFQQTPGGTLVSVAPPPASTSAVWDCWCWCC